jgi:hypothetical protein
MIFLGNTPTQGLRGYDAAVSKAAKDREKTPRPRYSRYQR